MRDTGDQGKLFQVAADIGDVDQEKRSDDKHLASINSRIRTGTRQLGRGSRHSSKAIHDSMIFLLGYSTVAAAVDCQQLLYSSTQENFVENCKLQVRSWKEC